MFPWTVSGWWSVWSPCPPGMLPSWRGRQLPAQSPPRTTCCRELQGEWWPLSWMSLGTASWWVGGRGGGGEREGDAREQQPDAPASRKQQQWKIPQQNNRSWRLFVYLVYFAVRQCPLLALLVRGPQMVWECVCVCVFMWNELEVCSMTPLAYPHISSLCTMPVLRASTCTCASMSWGDPVWLTGH